MRNMFDLFGDGEILIIIVKLKCSDAVIKTTTFIQQDMTLRINMKILALEYSHNIHVNNSIGVE